jgi:hypothetical protein
VEQTPQGFASEDEEATYCLSLLRDGDRHQQIVARERLSQIFEGRGMLDEAAQCLESNIREGVRDPRVYQRLAGVYRRQGRHELADEVLVEARRLAERLARAPQSGPRRPAPGRPVRPGPGAPSEPRDVPTAQLPASAPPPRAEPPPGGSGELELDRYGTGLQGWSGGEVAAPQPPVSRPWWLSPAMLVILILLCGPYGLALMWVRSDYSRQAKVRATVVWGGLIVLMMAGLAVVLQTQRDVILASVAGAGRIPGAPRIGAAPTPIVFGTPSAPGGVPKATLPPGLSALPPTPAASPGALGTRPAGVTIAPPAAAKPETEGDDDEPAATASPAPPGGAPAAKPSGEQVKVAESADTGVNMRERPGAAGPVIKSLPAGTVLQVVGADQQMDGMAWKNVRDDTGSTGWIAAEFLEPA